MDMTIVANLPEAELETKNLAINAASDESLRRIEEALRNERGVKEVKVDRENGIASVTFDTRETNLPELHDALLKSGYRPSRSLAE